MKRIIAVFLSVLLLAAAVILPASAVDKVMLTYDLMYDGKTFQQSVTKGEAPLEQYFERDGYETCKCYADAQFKKRFDFSKPLYENKTVYVRWLTEDELVYVRIYLGADHQEPTLVTDCVKGEAYGQPAQPGHEDQYFAGWYKNRALTVPYDPTEPLYSDTELFACFVDSQDEVTGYNIFDSPSAEEPTAGGFIKKNTNMFIPATPEMSDDEMLMGWYYDRALTVEADFAQPVTASYISLFPKILSEEDVYWVTLYLGADDEFPLSGFAVEKGQPIPKPADPGKDDLMFGGWYYDRALTKAADFTAPQYDDKELFARWDAIHNHQFEEVAEVPATATTDGLMAHYICTVCGKWYEPTPTAIIEIADRESLVIPATGPYVMGDANGDGIVNIRDVTAIQRFLAQLRQYHFCRSAANVISSDGLNISDATRIQGYFAELYSTL